VCFLKAWCQKHKCITPLSISPVFFSFYPFVLFVLLSTTFETISNLIYYYVTFRSFFAFSVDPNNPQLVPWISFLLLFASDRRYLPPAVDKKPSGEAGRFPLLRSRHSWLPVTQLVVCACWPIVGLAAFSFCIIQCGRPPWLVPYPPLPQLTWNLFWGSIVRPNGSVTPLFGSHALPLLRTAPCGVQLCLLYSLDPCERVSHLHLSITGKTHTPPLLADF